MHTQTSRTRPRAAERAPRPLAETLILTALVTATVVTWWAAATGATPTAFGWVFLRLSGIAGYAALTITVALGALTAGAVVPKWLAKPLQYGWHGLLSGFGLGAVATHIAFTLIDAEYPQTLAAVLVPGLATYAPVALALGTLAFYAMVVVHGSFALRQRLPRRLVRGLHLLAYPAFVLATVHGLWAGSDRLPWLYPTGLGLVVLATAVRLLEPRPSAARSRS